RDSGSAMASFILWQRSKPALEGSADRRSQTAVTAARLTPRLGFVRLGAGKLSIGFLPFTRELRGGLALIAILLTASSCAVRRTTRVPVAQAPLPTLEASTTDLVGRINAQSAAIRTLNLTVDLAPTAGSVYSGVIKEYRDVRAFILVEKPGMIRMI